MSGISFADGVDKHLTAKIGLFEDIERAWFTVDNKLFLWDYNDGSVSGQKEVEGNADDLGAISADMTSNLKPYSLLA